MPLEGYLDAYRKEKEVGGHESTAAVKEQIFSPPQNVVAVIPEMAPVEFDRPEELAPTTEAVCHTKQSTQPRSTNSSRQPVRKPHPDELKPGAILPVQEVVDEPIVTIPGDVAERMSVLTREVVGRLVKDYRGKAIVHASVQEDRGLEFSLEQMCSYGMDLTKLLAELHGLGWLYVDPEKPGRKIHMAKIGGKSVQSSIFKPQVAIDLGFVD